jgi:hypothetical protein
METIELDRYDGGKLTINLCSNCYVIWFDRYESTQMAPAAVIDLFKEIHRHQDEERHPLPPHLDCPRCSGPLTLTRDICKAGPLSYYRCQHDHGRLTPFFQFLREKQFVRSLTQQELHQVRTELHHVSCPSCGANVDLERSTCCDYCGAPIAVLDADAVDKAMAIWTAAEDRRRVPLDDARIQALTATLRDLSRQPDPDTQFSVEFSSSFTIGSDLISCCIGALGKLIVTLENKK